MEGGTDGVAGGVFLLGADDGAGALGFVQGSFAADDGLTLRCTAVGLAADLGDSVPVVSHGGTCLCGRLWEEGYLAFRVECVELLKEK